MDIVLGVSMTPTTVRMVLVEGEKGDGLTVDHDAFDIASGDAAATASEQVVTAILGTRESAAEGGHRLVATGVAWRDHDEAAALRDALAARHIDDVMLVSELHAAGALAQAVGRAVGYDRTALMFLERDTATLSVVQVSDGSIVKVQTQDLHSADAVAQLAAMVAGLEELDAPPQGVFVVAERALVQPGADIDAFDPGFVGVAAQLHPVRDIAGAAVDGDQFGDPGALGEVVVIGPVVVGLHVGAGPPAAAPVELHPALHPRQPTRPGRSPSTARSAVAYVPSFFAVALDLARTVPDR